MKKFTVRSLVILSGLFFVSGISHAEVKDFKWSRPVMAEVIAEDEILSVPLDAPLYRETRLDYGDLRVVQDQRGHVPYLLEKMTSNDVLKVIREVPSEVDGIEKPDDNRLVFYLAVTATNEPVVYGLFVDTPLRDFERQVNVSGKTADGGWLELVTNALLYDYTRFIDLRETRVKLPPGYFKIFRVEIDNVTEEKESTLVELERTFRHREEIQRTDRTEIEKRPFRINRINLWTEEHREVVRVDRKSDYPVVSFEVDIDSNEKTTVVTVKTQREPLTEFAIAADGQNFNRRAEVLVAVHDGVRKSWRTIGSDVISQIHFRDFNHTQATLSFAEFRADEYRIVIQNQDNPPLQVTGVTARGTMYHLLFLARPGEKYSLGYGNDLAVKPQYDAGPIVSTLRGGYTPRFVLAGEPVLNKKFRSGRNADFFNSKIFFGLAACFFVAILVSALYRASKKIGPSIDGP